MALHGAFASGFLYALQSDCWKTPYPSGHQMRAYPLWRDKDGLLASRRTQ